MEEAKKSYTSDVWIDIISMDMYKCMKFLSWVGYDLVQQDLKDKVPGSMMNSYVYYAEEIKKGADINTLADVEFSKGEIFKRKYKEFEAVAALWYFSIADKKGCIDVLKAARYNFLDYSEVLEFDIVKNMVEDIDIIDKEIKYLTIKINREDISGCNDEMKEQVLSAMKLRLILRRFERALLNNNFSKKHEYMEALSLIMNNIYITF